MNILYAIENMKSEFLMQTGKEATDIYLGIEEMQAVLKELKLQYSISLTGTDNFEATLCGLRLHKTIDNSHLGVGKRL